MSGLFADKRGLITGVFNKQSIAWAISEQILAGGGQLRLLVHARQA